MIKILKDLEAISSEAADIFCDTAAEANAEGRDFRVALSGGSTPRRLYEQLASPPWREQVQWNRVQVFWGDERCVPVTDSRSNANLAEQLLLRQVPLPRENIHRVCGDLPAEQAALKYEARLREHFGERLPIFDLILLGLGSDAHTASLFPYSTTLGEMERWVAAVPAAGAEPARVTFTIPLINHARRVLFMVHGAEKAEALWHVLAGETDVQKYPAQSIRPVQGAPIWLVDQAAASRLRQAGLLAPDGAGSRRPGDQLSSDRSGK